MKLRGNLFIRMFIAFWLLTILILASWMLSSRYFESRPPPREYSEHQSGGPPHRFLLPIIYNLQNLEDDALAMAVANVRQEHGIEIYLVDRANSDVLGRNLPPEVQRLARRIHGARRRAVLSTPGERLVAHAIYRPQQGMLRAVFVFPARPGPIMDALGGNVWLRIALAILISGVVCFGLSRLMTNRLKDLQQASRRLADGELNARLQVRGNGGDETDELARDFNTMAEQLQQRIQAQKRLLGDVSHELRSPLARLRVALALAQEKPDNAPVYLGRIEQEAERLEELIGQLLSTQADDMELDAHIDLVPLLTQLCADANFEGQVDAKEVDFNATTQEAIVDSNSDLLRKCFDNILRNALHHTAHESRVKVSLQLSGDKYQVSIEDQGPGVPEEDLGHIFDEFFRVDSARSRASGGYGLGLAIARRAIGQHGGEVTAENTGTGLRITVLLPQSDQGTHDSL